MSSGAIIQSNPVHSANTSVRNINRGLTLKQSLSAGQAGIVRYRFLCSYIAAVQKVCREGILMLRWGCVARVKGSRGGAMPSNTFPPRVEIYSSARKVQCFQPFYDVIQYYCCVFEDLPRAGLNPNKTLGRQTGNDTSTIWLVRYANNIFPMTNKSLIVRNFPSEYILQVQIVTSTPRRNT